MPRRGRAAAEERVDRVELLGMVIVVNADLDEPAWRVGRHCALEDVTALDDRLDFERAHRVLGECAADFARRMLARAAPAEPDQ